MKKGGEMRVLQHRLFRLCIRVSALITFSFAQVTGAAVAQSYPTRPIRVVVPLAPAGTTDIVARVIAQKFNEAWGQPVIIDNRPGAGTTLGSGLVARATPDGYTLLFNSVSLATTVPLYRNLSFDPVKDLAPIGPVGQSFYVLAVPLSTPINSVQEFIALAKAKPKQILYASAGQGTITHLAVELFMARAQISMVNVPFKGGAPALVAFLSGQVQAIFSPIAEILPHVRVGGKVRTLAVTSPKRVPELPETPTLTESGLVGADVITWSGIYAPAGTPRTIVNQLNAELNRMVQQPEVRERFLSIGLVPVGGTPAALGDYLKSEIARWTKVVKDAGIKLE
jgi:tripartite-type tricarboxylate transporter receptor subunit TctC